MYGDESSLLVGLQDIVGLGNNGFHVDGDEVDAVEAVEFEDCEEDLPFVVHEEAALADDHVAMGFVRNTVGDLQKPEHQLRAIRLVERRKRFITI
ncbi:hypothetical protein L596_029751 [Steinernema carpocapsae]|uniref:Uncharacterized protein n=1 Tax=Steinernema carpocapsae TaxID=34508 RepID=A0A4U5LQQ9_STECR|nr:hypothetical protein L596_029751 [Steinernema carpocapsae]